MPAPVRNIALFGSSFNPPHVGHAAVIKDLLADAAYDEVWLVPVYNHPFPKDLAPFAARLEMLEVLKAELADPRARVSQVERELDRNPSYAIDTVTELKRRHPDCEFTIVAGSDVKRDLPHWHRTEELQKLARFRFIERGGEAGSKYPSASSTEIRAKIRAGGDVSLLTTPGIAAYLEKHGLYKNPA